MAVLNYDHVFLGSKKAGIDVFQSAHAVSSDKKWLVVCPDDADDPRSIQGEFVAVCRKLGVDFRLARTALEFEKVVEPAHSALVCGWYWLLSSKVLSMFHGGVWGIHHSLLPKYRGGSPLVWALIHGEPKVGSTFFRLGEGIDDGGILAQVETLVNPKDNISAILSRLNRLIVREVAREWPRVLGNDVELLSQNDHEATYFPIRNDLDGRIDWGWPANQVYDFVRAQSPPYPGAHSSIDDIRVRIFSCEVSHCANPGPTGRITQLGDGQISIACGNQSEIIVRLENLRADRGEAKALVHGAEFFETSS